MRSVRKLGICTVALICGTASVSLGRASAGQQAAGPPKPGLTLTTMAFDDGGVIPAKYTQSSPSPVTPDLEWSNVPANTASFVLILHDPDVAIRKGTDDVLHWMAFNIAGTASGLAEGVPTNAQLLDGTIQAKNLRGGVGFMAPGAGAAGPYHHYTFELFALDTKLTLGADATRADVLKAMDGHILGKGVLVGRFHR